MTQNTRPEVQDTPAEQDYLLKPQVAEILACSERTIDSLVRQGTLHTRPLKRPGKRPLVTFDPTEVERERLNRQTKAMLTSGPNPHAGELMQTISQSTALATFQAMQENMGSSDKGDIFASNIKTCSPSQGKR